MNRTSIGKLALTSWAILGLSLACESPARLPPPPSIEDLHSAFALEAGDSDEGDDGSPVLRVYVDASGSMAGFLAAPHNQFRRTIDQLLDRSMASGYDVSVFKFGSGVTPLPDTTSVAALTARGFFDEDETSFPDLLRAIDEARDEGGVSVVVTDLVQSGRTGEQRELSRAFHELAAQPFEVLLVAQRSSFRGFYWPESTVESDRIRLDLGGIAREESRPFYLLLIADERRELESFHRRLEIPTEGVEAGLSWTLDAARPAIALGEPRFAPASSEVGEGWQVAKRQDELYLDAEREASVFWLSESGRVLPKGHSVRLAYQTTGSSSLADLGRVAATAERCDFTFDSRCRAPEAALVSVGALRDKDTGQVLVDYRLPRPEVGTWTAYHVRLYPGEANLRRSMMVDLWTTDDDSAVGQGTRTYKLELFVDTLLAALREQTPLAEHVLVLGRSR